MDPTHYLASLAGFPTPGRFCLRTKPVKDKAQIAAQAQILHEFLSAIHTNSCRELSAAYQSVISATDQDLQSADKIFASVFAQIKASCYPYIRVPERSIFDIMSATALHSQAFAIRMPTIDHYVTITAPNIMEDYLKSEMIRVLSDGYELEVGLSIVPIPILFALDHCGISDQPLGRRTEFVQSFFQCQILPRSKTALLMALTRSAIQSLLLTTNTSSSIQDFGINTKDTSASMARMIIG